MNLLILVFVGYSAFGFGAAALLRNLFDTAIERESGARLFGTLARILSWFLGNGALALVTLSLFDLDRLLKCPAANGVAIVAYMTGFGLTVGVMTLRRTHSVVRRAPPSSEQPAARSSLARATVPVNRGRGCGQAGLVA